MRRNYMNKSDFIKEISSLSREEIQKRLLEKNDIRKKLIYPVVYIKKKNNKGDNT